MTRIAANSTSPIHFENRVPRWNEGAAPRLKQVAKCVGVLAATVLSYFIGGWVAFFCVAAVGITFLAISLAREARAEAPVVNGPRKIFQDLPSIQNNGIYANLDLFNRWFFDGPNLLKNSVRFHLGKMPEQDRAGFIERLDRMEENETRECYVTALKILVFYPLLVMYREKPEYQGFIKPYRVPGAQPGFRDRTTFNDLQFINWDLYDYERFPGEAARPLTSDEKNIFINLTAHDVLHNTPAAQQAPERVIRHMRGLIEIADRLAEPDHHLNEALRQLLRA